MLSAGSSALGSTRSSRTVSAPAPLECPSQARREGPVSRGRGGGEHLPPRKRPRAPAPPRSPGAGRGGGAAGPAPEGWCGSGPRGAMDSLWRLKRFDAFPKTLEDFRVKTCGGALGERPGWGHRAGRGAGGLRRARG